MGLRSGERCGLISGTCTKAMTGESVSFRITRTTEDLAQTVAALSQRLVRLEQRLEAIALQLDRLAQPAEPDADELRRLDQVAVLLADCRNLLDDTDQSSVQDMASADADSEQVQAA
jgi:hypothetical protein